MLGLGIKPGDGFTIGPDIVVKLKRTANGYVRVVIQAPQQLSISRVDGVLADMLISKLSKPLHVP